MPDRSADTVAVGAAIGTADATAVASAVDTAIAAAIAAALSCSNRNLQSVSPTVAAPERSTERAPDHSSDCASLALADSTPERATHRRADASANDLSRADARAIAVAESRADNHAGAEHLAAPDTGAEQHPELCPVANPHRGANSTSDHAAHTVADCAANVITVAIAVFRTDAAAVVSTDAAADPDAVECSITVPIDAAFSVTVGRTNNEPDDRADHDAERDAKWRADAWSIGHTERFADGRAKFVAHSRAVGIALRRAKCHTNK